VRPFLPAIMMLLAEAERDEALTRQGAIRKMV
jgi:hypothetical protein